LHDELRAGAPEHRRGEYPAQNWIDVSSADAERGIALLNRGLPAELSLLEASPANIVVSHIQAAVLMSRWLT